MKLNLFPKKITCSHQDLEKLIAEDRERNIREDLDDLEDTLHFQIITIRCASCGKIMSVTKNLGDCSDEKLYWQPIVKK